MNEETKWLVYVSGSSFYRIAHHFHYCLSSERSLFCAKPKWRQEQIFDLSFWSLFSGSLYHSLSFFHQIKGWMWCVHRCDKENTKGKIAPSNNKMLWRFSNVKIHMYERRKTRATSIVSVNSGNVSIYMTVSPTLKWELKGSSTSCTKEKGNKSVEKVLPHKNKYHLYLTHEKVHWSNSVRVFRWIFHLMWEHASEFITYQHSLARPSLCLCLRLCSTFYLEHLDGNFFFLSMLVSTSYKSSHSSNSGKRAITKMNGLDTLSPFYIAKLKN